jgi:hypothetical protein
MSPTGRIALATIAFFNALLLLAIAIGSVMFVDGDAGPILAACLCVVAAALLALSHRLRDDTGWR